MSALFLYSIKQILNKMVCYREHFLVMNVAVGGTGYFPDDVSLLKIFIILMKSNI